LADPPVAEKKGEIMNKPRYPRASIFKPGALRAWFRYRKRIFRLLCFTNYGDCEYGLPPKEFFMRLPNTDKRPRGVHMWGLDGRESIAEFYNRFTLNTWHQH